ncbi:VENN motif pre-toxin domain-containing protein [Cronobacter dublinensis]|nr:VENN motif pre-toxin domain-containing protein [Cronobacter dublinensis]
MVKAQGGNAAAGAAGGFVAASGSKRLSAAFYNTKSEELFPDEKTVIVNLVAAPGAAGGSMAAGNSTGISSGSNAARVEVENNSLTGDAARQSVKQSAEWWKEHKNTASQLANGLINLASETGDIAMLGGDTTFDVMAALAACATGDSYCSQAKNDIAKKDAAAANVLNGIMNGDAWEGIKPTAIKAANGDLEALENVAGKLFGVFVPAKVLSGEKSASTVSTGKGTVTSVANDLSDSSREQLVKMVIGIRLIMLQKQHLIQQKIMFPIGLLKIKI